MTILLEYEYVDIVNAVLTFDSDKVSEATKKALAHGRQDAGGRRDLGGY